MAHEAVDAGPVPPPAALAEARWPQLGQRPLVLVPVGSMEQHGPHLPLSTDTVVAAEVARAAAQRLAGSGAAVTLAPPLAYGASGEHQSFTGTVSIGHDALRVLVLELCRSMAEWAGRIVLVNAHGGNVPTITDVVGQLRYEGRDVAWVPCAFETRSDAHAGLDETSVMLHLAPDLVHMELAEPGNTSPLPELLPLLMASGVMAASPNGVLGDPTGATAENGARLFEGCVADVVGAILDGSVAPDGRAGKGGG